MKAILKFMHFALPTTEALLEFLDMVLQCLSWLLVNYLLHPM